MLRRFLIKYMDLWVHGKFQNVVCVCLLLILLDSGDLKDAHVRKEFERAWKLVLNWFHDNLSA